jgi:thermitase
MNLNNRVVGAGSSAASALISIGFCVLLSAYAQTAAAQDRTIQYVKGRVLVQPRAGLSDKEFDKILQVHGGKRGKRIPQINLHVIELPAQANEQAVAKALAAIRT